MNRRSPAPIPASSPSRRSTLFAVAAIVIAAILCYANSLHGVFLFDDLNFILENPAVRTLWPPFGWLSHAPARPVGYFTFAVNYALHGYDVVGYHVVNVAIHMTTALALFGLVRRTLRLPRVADRYRRHADPLAAALVLIWVVHPLGTQAVTYVYQRLESLAAMFAVLALYGFVRAFADSERPQRRWAVGSLVFAYLAMLTKEAVYGLPLIVLCYDRLFVAHAWRDLAARRWYHVVLCGSWALAGALMIASRSDYDSAGIGTVIGVTPFTYALSEAGVLLRYLQLSFVPVGLCFDYAKPPVERWPEFVPQTLAILGLLSASCVGLYRGRLWSFPAVAFFLLLAPSSSIVPIADLVEEYRMYLPLACVAALAIAGAFELLCRFAERGSPACARACGVGVLGVAVIAFAAATIVRNFDYSSGVRMWSDVVAKAPHNARAFYNLARFQLRQRNREEGMRRLAEALRLSPGFPLALLEQAARFIDDGRIAEAEACLERVQPSSHEVVQYYMAVGRLRFCQQRLDEAADAYLAALERRPQYGEALANLGLIQFRRGDLEKANALSRAALEADAENALARNNLGNVYAANGRNAEAAAEFSEALRHEPYDAVARMNYGLVLNRLGRDDEALVELKRAIVDGPSYVDAFVNLGAVLARRGRFAEAAGYLERAVALDPSNPTAQQYLADVRRDLQSAESGTNAVLATP